MLAVPLIALGLALAVSGLPLVPPAGQASVVAAQPAGRTWRVYNGGESADAAIQVNAFRPSRITIGVGDSVTWVLDSTEAHTVTFLSGGARPPSTLRIGSLQFRNPLVLAPAGGSVYDGTGYVNSGLLQKGDTFTLTFVQPGTYEYVCLIHGTQRGQVEVRAEGAPAEQTQASLDREAQDALARNLERGESLRQEIAVARAPGQVVVGAGAGDVSVRAFGPAEVTIRVGETVTWTSEVSTPHTVTFTSGAPLPSYWQPEAQGGGFALLVANPEAATRQGGDTYDGTGYLNSGVMTNTTNSSYTLRFVQPGTYEYVCLLHPEFGMRGTVTVLP
ncbi:MAG TPA: plastocyanin/azurin family copper-binding protein [Chloroflexota bacterium]|nr:plastocyanin/azurin family copper-binding protein [Chloroflexota bacterium]HZU07764.1 plastocyanin/azurin family copper-binding protein [Chloroflexota bacterium]